MLKSMEMPEPIQGNINFELCGIFDDANEHLQQLLRLTRDEIDAFKVLLHLLRMFMLLARV